MTCIWTQEDLDGDAYWTSCGNGFVMNDDTPQNNGFKFCCYCGKPLKQELRGDDYCETCGGEGVISIPAAPTVGPGFYPDHVEDCPDCSD